MKIIYRMGQIEELEDISRRDRRALFRQNHWKVFRHWQGWLGFFCYVVGIFLIASSRNLLPEGEPLWKAWLLISPAVIILFAIYVVTYYTTLAPYVRRDVAFWRSKGFL
jgi:hypothetical protein